MEGMKWDYFSNVEVLQLSRLHWGYGALNLEGLVRLRVLQLLDASKIDRIEGLGKLKHLTYFICWTTARHSSNDKPAHIVGQFPSSLRRLDIWGHVVLGSDLLVHSPNLSKLNLTCVEMDLLGLSDFGSLEHVELWSIRKLQTISRLAINQSSNLQSLIICGCYDLVDVPRIDLLVGLKKLYFDDFPNCEMPNLLALTNLEVLNILGEQRLVVPAKDCFPCQLQELRWCSRLSSTGLNLCGFNQLEFLDLSDNDGLTSLAKLGDLPALQQFDLSCCKHLLQLPDLSMSRNLRELNLEGCNALELHEKDIQMLSELPLLEPVPFGVFNEAQEMIHAYNLRLDCARGKVLRHSRPSPRRNWLSREEQDLGAGGIRLGLYSWHVNGDATWLMESRTSLAPSCSTLTTHKEKQA